MPDAATRLSTALADCYTIDRELGAGGMATVYLARDLKHDREVAIKVLKPELAAVLGAERFVQEIRTTAALQHPNILPLFDSGEADGFLYYVMPYVEGETLRAKLDRETQLGVDEAVKVTTEVADALQYAHEHGVVHRDIKPENILIHVGRPVVADFGIALAVSAAAGGRMTETGLSLGTPHYMSPEQATAAKEITGRSDIYSLGAVLYEMLTGNPPHTGASAQQIIMKIVTEEAAPVTQLRKAVPPNVAAAVAKALEKLPADRFASAREFANALGDVQFTTVQPGAAGGAAWTGATRLRRKRWTVMGSIAAGALIAGILLGHRIAPAISATAVAFVIQPPDSVRSAGACCGPGQVLSPDGSALVFVGTRAGSQALYRRSLEQLTSEKIPGTDGASEPFISPDGRWLGFVRDNKLQKMLITGGPTTPIMAAPFAATIYAGSWAGDDTITYSAGGRLWRVAASGGAPRAVPSPTSDSTLGYPFLQYPFLLPGGRRALVQLAMGPTERMGVVDLRSGKLDTLGFGKRPQYANGFLVFAAADKSLLVQPFDAARGQTTGAATVLVTGLLTHGPGMNEFSVANNGTLEYNLAGGRDAGGFELMETGASGQTAIDLPGRTGDLIQFPAISPDGRRIAMQLFSSDVRGGGADIWILDRQQGTISRLTTGGGLRPVWSHDGRQIAYIHRGNSAARQGLYAVRVGRTDPPRLLLATPRAATANSWLPDDHAIVFSTGGFTPSTAGGRDTDIGTVALGDTTPRWLVRSNFHESEPRVSPDGRGLAYVSNRTGSPEVYVQPMIGSAAPVPISTNGGASPRWSRDGRTLYYSLDGSSIIAATLAPGPTIVVASRKVVADALTLGNGWDVFPDRKHFLYVRLAVAESNQMVLVEHWPALLRASSGRQ